MVVSRVCPLSAGFPGLRSSILFPHICAKPHDAKEYQQGKKDMDKSFFKDLLSILFSPKQFLKQRFLKLSSTRIFYLGYCGVFLGLVGGSLVTYWFSNLVSNDFTHNSEPYLAALKSLSLSGEEFLELLKTQRAYSLLLALLSPVIAYMAPHLFGGALFVFLYLLVRQQEKKLNFFEIMECSSISLVAMIFYILPGIGPLLAIVLVSINVSRALYIRYKLSGFMKVMAIISALYVCFFLSSASLQLLALPFSMLLKW